MSFVAGGKEPFLAVKKILQIIFISASMILVSGCISPTAYVDPALPKIGIASLQPPSVKRPLRVYFEFQSKGSTNFTATKALQPHVVSVLERSGFFSHVVTQGSADQKMYITVNNIELTKDAASKGFRVGLTFGLTGTMVSDGYKMDVVYQRVEYPAVKKQYSHAIHTTIGNASGPPGVVGMSVQDAVLKMMEELILNMLNDLRKRGDL